MSQVKNKYDVIIVGAGPSGCSCAFELKKYNKSVLLVDKYTFPRHKPCAGGITIKNHFFCRMFNKVIEHLLPS